MTEDRYRALGIKQTIRFEWLQKTTNLLLAGLDGPSVRAGLHDHLTGRKGNGTMGARSERTREFVVFNLTKTWVTPSPALDPLRADLLAVLRENPAMAPAVHWAMISAAYPFWFNVAGRCGRLLTLQGQVTHAQIVRRLKEHYGDRETVSRYSQFVIRSFVAWGVLKDSGARGCYEKAAPLAVTDTPLVALMLEAALYTVPEGKAPLRALLAHPAFFPFHFPLLGGDQVSRHNSRLDAIRLGLDEELLQLRGR
jgi:hypothetical protein